MCYPVQHYDRYFVVDLTYLRTLLLGDKHACVHKIPYIANVNIGMLISFTGVLIKMCGTK